MNNCLTPAGRLELITALLHDVAISGDGYVICEETGLITKEEALQLLFMPSGGEKEQC